MQSVEEYNKVNERIEEIKRVIKYHKDEIDRISSYSPQYHGEDDDLMWNFDYLEVYEKELKKLQESQNGQNRRDIQEFFGIHVPLEYKDIMQLEHDEKTGYDIPVQIPQTIEELRIAEGKLKRILEKKLASGEIDEATYQMMDDKVSDEYYRIRKDRQVQKGKDGITDCMEDDKIKQEDIRRSTRSTKEIFRQETQKEENGVVR